MRVLVTGAAGFVGTHLVAALAARGIEVVATDRELDVSDAPAVESAVVRVRPDALVHLAAVSSAAASRRSPQLTYRVNYLGSRAVLEALSRRAPRCRLLLIGSGEQYGAAQPSSAPFREASPQRPRSAYARTKAAADLLAASYAERGLDVVRVRAFNHTGPGQSDNFAMSSFARQAVEIAAGRHEPVVRVGNLDSVRDFLDIDDVVDAYLRLLERAAPAGTYNVARGVGWSIGELLEGLLARAGTRPAIVVDRERLRPVDVLVGDASRLRAATGWAPRVPIEKTFERLLDHWRRALNAS